MAAALPFIAVATQVIGAISQGNTASRNASAQENMARYNAQVSRNQAQSALQVSAQEQEASRQNFRRIAGMQRTASAQSGVGMGGSNADLLDQSATAAELEALNIAYGGTMQAQGFESQAALDTYQAGQYKSNAKDAKRAGYINAASSIFGAASKDIPSPSRPSASSRTYAPNYSLSTGRSQSSFGVQSGRSLGFQSGGRSLRSIYG